MGKGYNRLIAWEGEKTMTFSVTDALMSPMGLAVLSGAGLIKADNDHIVHVHMTVDADVDGSAKAKIAHATLAEELGVPSTTTIKICKDDAIKVYGTVLDESGAGIDWVDEVSISAPTTVANGLVSIAPNGTLEFTVGTAYKNQTVRFDFYVAMAAGATEITIEPGDFGGYFYVEADTLFRQEKDGKDIAATLTFPRVKVQSGFTFSMAASGDPSTFDFTMDAFPGYTQFNHTKKMCVVMDIVGEDKKTVDNSSKHGGEPQHTA